MYMGIKNIVYSHSDYFDVLEIFLEQQKNFGIDNIVIFSDKEFNNKNPHILYENALANLMMKLFYISMKICFCIKILLGQRYLNMRRL